MPKMFLRCDLVDICLPEFWEGSDQAWVRVPVSHESTWSQVRNDLIYSLIVGEVQGKDLQFDHMVAMSKWHEAAMDAIDDLMERESHSGNPFKDLEPLLWKKESPQAYFVFR